MSLTLQNHHQSVNLLRKLLKLVSIHQVCLQFDSWNWSFKIENLSGITKIKWDIKFCLVEPEEPENPNLRRSKRARVKPLAWWAGEGINYNRRKSGRLKKSNKCRYLLDINTNVNIPLGYKFGRKLLIKDIFSFSI